MLNLSAKLTQSLFLIKQYAPAPSRVCRPLFGFPVCTDNVFLQSYFLAVLLSYSSAYPQGFQNSPHRNGAPAAWSICGAKCIPVQHLWVLQADTPRLPTQEPPDMTQRTQLFNTLLWRRPLLSPGCFYWEQGTRTAELLWFYCPDIGIAKNQSKGQAASQKLYNLHHFLFFFCSPILCSSFLRERNSCSLSSTYSSRKA